MGSLTLSPAFFLLVFFFSFLPLWAISRVMRITSGFVVLINMSGPPASDSSPVIVVTLGLSLGYPSCGSCLHFLTFNRTEYQRRWKWVLSMSCEASFPWRCWGISFHPSRLEASIYPLWFSATTDCLAYSCHHSRLNAYGALTRHPSFLFLKCYPYFMKSSS